jgi:Ribonuclease G/E
MGLGLAHVFAEEALDVGARPADPPQEAGCERDHLARQAPGPRRGPQSGVPVARLGQAALVQPVEERRGKLGAARSAEADRIGEARLERDAVVPHARRQVEEVARADHHAPVAEAPRAPARALQQEHVVGVDVRPDAAARRGIAHHHVVETSLRHEVEALQQGVGGRDMKVDAVH